MNKGKKIILVTGCSSGIGKAISKILFSEGNIIIATARDVKYLEDIEVSDKLYLDVQKQDSIDNAITYVTDKYGKLDILINNAGIGVLSTLEDMPMEKITNIYDTNVFGVLRMVKAVLPIMRKNKNGIIINMSSLAGKFSVPILGAYCSTKFALEAISDVLSMELKNFGIKVIIVEPGNVNTSFDKNTLKASYEIMEDKNSPYYEMYKTVNCRRTSINEIKIEPEQIARLVKKIISKKRLKYRYQAPFSSSLISKLVPFFDNNTLLKMFSILQKLKI